MKEQKKETKEQKKEKREKNTEEITTKKNEIPYKTGKFLVTGCAGFIGCFTAKKLLEHNFEVIGIDDLNDYYDVKLKKFRLDILKSFRKFTFSELDISKKDEVFSLKGEKLDCIFNLGARAGVRASIKNPQIYVDVNITGTLNLLSLCVENSIEKFVLASTSSVYAGVKAPFKESAKTDSPLSPYAATKKSAELLAYTFHKLYKIDTTIPRYFTVYGPAGRPDMSIFRFIKNIMEGNPIIIYGDGKQKRDFTYIDDIVEGTIKGTKKLGYKIINLGNSRPVELMYVVRLIEENLGKKAKIIFEKPNPADLPETCADITRAKKILHWEPKTPIEEGIKRTCEWFIENKEFIKTISTEEKI